MDRRRFISGLCLMVGLVLGSMFTNFVYKDYLSYGGQMDALVLNNKDLYVSSASLLPYIVFKRLKQYGICFLASYLLQPYIFLYGGLFLMSFFLGSMISLQVIELGIQGIIAVIFSFFPHFILYFIALFLLVKRNMREMKKEGTSFYERDSFIISHSIPVEIGIIVVGCIMESYINPPILSAVVNLLS